MDWGDVIWFTAGAGASAAGWLITRVVARGYYLLGQIEARHAQRPRWGHTEKPGALR